MCVLYEIKIFIYISFSQPTREQRPDVPGGLLLIPKAHWCICHPAASNADVPTRSDQLHIKRGFIHLINGVGAWRERACSENDPDTPEQASCI